MKKVFIGIAVVVLLAIVAIAGFLVYLKINSPNEVKSISSFEDCKAAGYPIMESNPEQCRTPDGKTFTNPVPVHPQEPSFGTATQFELNQKITFEDGLQVTLTAINDSRCKQGVQCIWAGELGYTFQVTGGNFKTTRSTVNLGTVQTKEKSINGYTFSLQLSSTETSATIIISKSVITPPPPATTLGKCYIGGCSGEVCSDQQGVVTSCIYKQEYACYKTATCERQPDGNCGWTQTAQLKACLGAS